MEILFTYEVLRMGLIYLHLLAFAAAAGAVALGDYALFSGRSINADLLDTSARGVSFALAGLWVTGAGVIWIDTGFDPGQLLAKHKILAKLTVVALLTLNGFALHAFAFPRIKNPQERGGGAALLPATLGSISVTSWIYAAFIGVAKPLVPALGYVGLIALYAAALGAAIAIALVAVRPVLVRRLGAGVPSPRSETAAIPAVS